MQSAFIINQSHCTMRKTLEISSRLWRNCGTKSKTQAGNIFSSLESHLNSQKDASATKHIKSSTVLLKITFFRLFKK